MEVKTDCFYFHDITKHERIRRRRRGKEQLCIVSIMQINLKEHLTVPLVSASCRQGILHDLWMAEPACTGADAEGLGRGGGEGHSIPLSYLRERLVYTM